jgi:hypothetical protein
MNQLDLLMSSISGSRVAHNALSRLLEEHPEPMRDAVPVFDEFAEIIN